MSDTLHALGWLLVMDYTRVGGCLMMMSVSGGGADGNNVRPGKGRERPYGGNLPLIWTDGQHCPIKWIMPPEQFYGVRCFIFCESLAVFQRTGSGPGRALARHNNSLEPKTVSARNLATVFYFFSVNYSCLATMYFLLSIKTRLKMKNPVRWHCLLLFGFLWSTRWGQCNRADPGDSRLNLVKC